MSTTSTTTTLNFNIYRTNDNSSAGHGTMVLSGPDSQNMYSADIKQLVMSGGPSFSPEEIKGPSSTAAGTVTIQLYTSQRNDLKMFLAKNPLESRVSYAGSLQYVPNGWIFNLTAVVA